MSEKKCTCIALTSACGWISMVVAFLVGSFIAHNNTSSVCGENAACTDFRVQSESLEDFFRRREPVVLRGAAKNIVDILKIEDFIPFDEIVTIMELEPPVIKNLFTYLQKNSGDGDEERIERRPLNASNIKKIKIKGKEAWGRISSSNSSMSIPALEKTSLMFFRHLKKDVHKIEEFSDENRVTRVWISRNSTTHTHFDESHNVFTQCIGTKTFLLWPPDSYSCLRLYPESHAAFRQAKISGVYKCPHFAVTLMPGDQLYIPPIWFHRPSSNGLSVSVNMWFRSSVQRLHDRVNSMGADFLSNCVEQECMSRLADFITNLLRIILSSRNPYGYVDISTWIRDTVLSRHEASCLSLHDDDDDDDDDESLYPQHKASSEKSSEFARQISIVLKSILRDDTNHGVRDVILADILERYARHVLKTETAICLFFYQFYSLHKI